MVKYSRHIVWALGHTSTNAFGSLKNLLLIRNLTKFSFPLIVIYGIWDFLEVYSRGAKEWQVAVSRFLNDWEIGEYEELLRILSGVSVNGSKDIPCWSLTPNGSFSVSPFIKNCLSSEMMASVSQLSRFGGSRFHPEFLSWEACRECFLTIDNLRRRGKFLVNDCFLCKNDDSTCRKNND